jgi:hypothetical protein
MKNVVYFSEEERKIQNKKIIFGFIGLFLFSVLLLITFLIYQRLGVIIELSEMNIKD